MSTASLAATTVALSSPGSEVRDTASKGLRLARLLTRHAADNPDFWAFKGNSERKASHGIFQYPAMMVPQLQGTLLDDALEIDQDAQTVYDPFVGSGTVVIEAILRGLNVVGADINPIALLLCSVKTRPIRSATLLSAIDRVIKHARQSHSECTLSFDGIDKWFTEYVKTRLYRLRQAIMSERSLDVRRFLWAALAETVRMTSNSRTSTFKMHIYSADILSSRRPEPIEVFEEVAINYSGLLQDLALQLEDKNLISKRRYAKKITLLQMDVRQNSGNLKDLKADILMTSPPYGDNQTTVPYGQHSYLPSQWISPKDLPWARSDLHGNLARDAYIVDWLSLGGSRVGANEKEATIAERSPTLSETINALRPHNPELRHKLVAYASDLDASFPMILDRLKPNAFMFWTLGSRRVGGLVIPLADIVRELLEHYHTTHVITLSRQIPGNAKRIALRNSQGATMRSEKVLVMQVRR